MRLFVDVCLATKVEVAAYSGIQFPWPLASFCQELSSLLGNAAFSLFALPARPYFVFYAALARLNHLANEAARPK